MPLALSTRPVLAALLLLAAPSVVAAQTDTAEVRTAATARRSVRPDHAVFTVQFTAEGLTTAEAGRNLAARADSVRRALMALGIPRDSLVTASSWYWWPERIQVVTTERRIPATPPARGYLVAVDTVPLPSGTGWQLRPIVDTTYRAREIMEVRAGDPARVGPAIDAALALRVTEISRIQFGATDVHQVQVALLREATARATEQAAAIAAASGGRLGRALYLGTQSFESTGRAYGFSEIVVHGTSTAAGTEITAPNVAVTMTVYGRWQLVR